ncbi:MAG TPA: hypothetical protein VMW50_12110 [Dehalococcoidia bacterium]|nr:hypothetical protein [Dehalococcoidia bacterium]
MSWLLGLVTKNPAVLAYIAGIAFICGLGAGAYPAWKYQGALKDAVQSKYDSFVAQTKADGVAAIKVATAKEASDKLNKEKSDEQIKVMGDELSVLSSQLYNSRASRGYLPKARSGTKRPGVVCLSRAKLDAILGQIDAAGKDIALQRDRAQLGLYVSCQWAKER